MQEYIYVILLSLEQINRIIMIFIEKYNYNNNQILYRTVLFSKMITLSSQCISKFNLF